MKPIVKLRAGIYAIPGVLQRWLQAAHSTECVCKSTGLGDEPSDLSLLYCLITPILHLAELCGKIRGDGEPFVIVEGLKDGMDPQRH